MLRRNACAFRRNILMQITAAFKAFSFFLRCRRALPDEKLGFKEGKVIDKVPRLCYH